MAAGISGQLDQKIGRGRPTSGISAAARELPLSGRSEEGRRKSAERAVKVAAIAPEAKAAAQAAGLDNNQRALLRVAAEKTPERQVATVAAIVTEKVERAAERSPEVTFETWIEEGRRWLARGTPEFQARAREALPFPVTQGERA